MSDGQRPLRELSVQDAEQRLQYLCSSTRAFLQERNRLGHEVAVSTGSDEGAFERAMPHFPRDKAILKQLHTLAGALDAWTQQPGAQQACAPWIRTVRELVQLLQEPSRELNDAQSYAMVTELYKQHPSLSRDVSADGTRPDDASSTDDADRADGARSFPSARLGGDLVDNVDSYRDRPAFAEGPDHREAAAQLSLQKTAFDRQDTQLDTLSKSISRQHQLSLQMNEELELQTGLLGDLDADVENTGLRLGGASGRLTRLQESMRQHTSSWIIIALVVLLVLLIALVK